MALVGKKLVYLPKFTVAMVRTPASKANPFLARFHVPLNFSKLDLRDYLRNLYQVEITKVRSWVRQSPVTVAPKAIDADGEVFIQRRRLRRPMSKKYMEVDLKKPFVWPEPPLRRVEDGEEITWTPEQSMAEIEDKMREEIQRPVIRQAEDALSQAELAVQESKERRRLAKSPEDLEPFQIQLSEAKASASEALEELATLITDMQSKNPKKLVEWNLSAWGGGLPETEHKAKEIADKEEDDNRRRWAADQFKALKSGETKWRPTWQELQR